MFTLALVRFPPTATKEIQYLNAKGALTYTDIAGDPVLYGNLPRSEERFSRNAETDLVCRLLLEKKKKKHMLPIQRHYWSVCSLAPRLDINGTTVVLVHV